jgi:CRISPR-associated endonuclease/helicase Cas3
VENLYASLKRVEIANCIRPEGWSVLDVAELAMQECGRTGSCLVVVNTKKWARALYEECRRRGAKGLFHLSTNLCPANRMLKLDAIRESLDQNRLFPDDRQPVLCISTQLIEAGVDVDFASAIRFVAGLDSILQAAGRCNRNGLAECGLVHLVNPLDEDLSKLRDIKEGREQTLRVIGEFERDEEFEGDLLHPAVIERYFEYYFFDRAGEMAYPVSADRAGRDDTLLNMLSCNPRNGGSMGTEPAMRQSFASTGRLFAVIDAPTQGIIVPYGEGRRIICELCSESDPAKIRHLLRLAQRYTVNVYPNIMRKLIERHAVHEIQKSTGIYYLADGHYDESFGLSAEKVGIVGAYFA